jgi:hypothetical protein
MSLHIVIHSSVSGILEPHDVASGGTEDNQRTEIEEMKGKQRSVMDLQQCPHLKVI